MLSLDPDVRNPYTEEQIRARVNSMPPIFDPLVNDRNKQDKDKPVKPDVKPDTKPEKEPAPVSSEPGKKPLHDDPDTKDLDIKKADHTGSSRSAIKERAEQEKRKLERSDSAVDVVHESNNKPQKRSKKKSKSSNVRTVGAKGIWSDGIQMLRSLFQVPDDISLTYPELINLAIYALCRDLDLRSEWMSRLSGSQVIGLVHYFDHTQDPFLDIIDQQAELIKRVQLNAKKLNRLLDKQDADLVLSGYDLMDRKGWNTSKEVVDTNVFRAVPGPLNNGESDVLLDVINLAQMSVRTMRQKMEDPEGREIAKTVGNKTFYK